jgi:hypothetical protein
MKNQHFSTLALALSAGPALAFEPLTFGDFEAAIEGSLSASAVRDEGKVATGGSLDFALFFERPFGALTFGAELASKRRSLHRSRSFAEG